MLIVFISIASYMRLQRWTIKRKLIVLLLLFLSTATININCTGNNEKHIKRIVIFDHEPKNIIYIFDHETQEEYFTCDEWKKKREVRTDFKAEGVLFTADLSVFGCIFPDPQALCGFIDGRYFVIKRPAELKFIKPRIRNEKEALSFVRFLSSEDNFNMMWPNNEDIFNMLEITKTTDEVYGAISPKNWDELKLQPTIVRQKNRIFIIERNIIKKEFPNTIIRSLETVSRDGEYTFETVKIIPVPDNIYIKKPYDFWVVPIENSGDVIPNSKK